MRILNVNSIIPRNQRLQITDFLVDTQYTKYTDKILFKFTIFERKHTLV